MINSEIEVLRDLLNQHNAMLDRLIDAHEGNPSPNWIISYIKNRRPVEPSNLPSVCEYCGSKLNKDGEHTDEWIYHWIYGGKHKNSRLYSTWSTMRSRCNNKNFPKFDRYGGRGISVCSEWDKFAAFREWSVRNGYGPGMSIDRIDNDGNYEPGNCRWIPLPEQTMKLSPDEVRAIRDSNEDPKKLAEQYGVHWVYIYQLRRRGARADVK